MIDEPLLMCHFYFSSLIVQMPKYNISAKFSLKDTLESMGVVSPFSDTADFTGMTDQKVKVSKVRIR